MLLAYLIKYDMSF